MPFTFIQIHICARAHCLTAYNCPCALGCPSVPGYTVTPGMDHPGDDIAYVPNMCMIDLAPNCTATPGCVAFNWQPDGTMGWLKTQASMSPVRDTSNLTCFYVKTGKGWIGAIAAKWGVKGKGGGPAGG